LIAVLPLLAAGALAVVLHGDDNADLISFHSIDFLPRLGPVGEYYSTYVERVPAWMKLIWKILHDFLFTHHKTISVVLLWIDNSLESYLLVFGFSIRW
jgi:hypothetical protein